MDRSDAEELMRAGEFQKAYEIYRELIDSGSQDPVVFNNCGVALDSLGKHREAVECYMHAVELDSEYATAYYNLANSLVFLREYSRALENYQKALTLNPNLREAYVDLANLYLLMNDLTMMRKTLKYAIERFRDDPDLVYSSALVLLDGGDVNAAISLLQYCLSIKDDPKYWNALGNAYYAQNRFDEALQSYETALKIDENNAEAWNNKGFTYFTLGKFEAAIDSYTRAIAINPNYRQAWYNRAYTYHAMGKLNKAVHDYWMALKLEPMDEVAWNNMGNALYNLKRYMPSIPYFMKAVTINPDYDIAWNNIGNALDRMGMHKYSIPFHEKALSLNKKFDYAWHAKGHALCALGHAEEALEYLETALDLNPDYGDTWYWRARCFYKLERYEEAIESLKIAVQRDPEDPVECYLLLAEIYDLLGYNTEAYKYYTKALELADDDKKAEIYIAMKKYEEALENATPALKARILYKLGRYDDILKIEGEEKKIKFIRALAFEAKGEFEKAYEELKDIKGRDFERERRFIEFVLGKKKFNYHECYDREFCLRVGSILLDEGKLDKAEEIFRKVKREESYYFLGKIYALRGEYKEARKYYDIAIGLGMEIPLDEIEEVMSHEKISSKQKKD